MDSQSDKRADTASNTVGLERGGVQVLDYPLAHSYGDTRL
jgi:hypothetical protein